MRIPASAAIFITLTTSALAQDPGATASGAVYGPRLEGFSYAHPVKIHSFTSQRQPIEMAYLDVPARGKANGKTVVLLHGKNFCAGTWEVTIDVLTTAGYRVIAPDQVGFCKSTKPPKYQFSFQQLTNNTAELIESLDVSDVILVGHSMGGMLAARYALQFPQTVERLVLVNPIGLEDWQAKGVPYATLDTAYASELKTSFASIKAYQQRVYYNGDWKPEYDRWVSMLAGMYAGEGKEIVAWNQAQTSDMIFTQPVIHEFGNISVPTTLIIGGKDRTAPGSNRASAEVAKTLGQYPKLGRAAAAAIPNATLVEFPELGHSPQIEAPGEFHSALVEAIK
ncbi:alpha/beta hydrolase [Mesorhizobium sp. M6A.T.Cr.TU.016.01.1.1]|uniref:alpha/beta fold hydrolase n=1 Tax=Mesorhizobium sp. M6A.T.Cr.TU.016.01.1.1 TaxID=2493677 RepID=UPI000F75DDC1|nr:alpha/beta hydrolase [Mesorhizobium sp. M6A.T.Cr.TU.016.01.1.1]AZO63720.1 alpha/beta hydrolase [Mesorhizobium sp. M6A.T.Cr.TU.016.01.1.1]